MFEFCFRFVFLVHRLLPNLMALSLEFAATIRRFTVFGLTCNMLVKRHSDFLALGALTGVDAIGALGILYVTPSGVDTTASFIISLRFCWSSHLPAY